MACTIFLPSTPFISCRLCWRFQKLAGPINNLKKGWAFLRGGLVIEPEALIGAEGRVHLGCRQIVSSVKRPNGGMAFTMTYDMEDFLYSCIQKYLELAGPKTSFEKVLNTVHCSRPPRVFGRSSWGRTCNGMPMVLAYGVAKMMQVLPVY